MVKTQTEPYLATYLHQRGYARGLPISGVFELTARCNFNCPMCYVHQTGEKTGELTAAQWLKLAREARDAGMVFALLTGGEPLLRKDFFSIYQGMKELGLMISINSNGSLLQGEILERLLQDPPNRINISLYGGCGETYRNMCGVDAYHSVKENIRRLKQAGVDVSLNLCITPFNKEDLPLIRADAERLNVPVRASAYLYPQSRLEAGSQTESRLDPKEAAKFELEWENLYYGRELMAERCRELKLWLEEGCPGNPSAAGDRVSCRAGTTSFWITWEGKMMPCGMVPDPEAYPLTQGFAKAWEEIREKTAAIRMPGACASCDKRSACGVCAAVCRTETGRYDGVPVYMCQKTEEKIRLLQGTGE